MKNRLLTVYSLTLIAVSVATTGCRSFPEPRTLTPEEQAERKKAEAVFKPARQAYVDAKTPKAREKALIEIRSAAVDVCPEAMYFYGFHYYSLEEPDDDEKEQAVTWINKAAEQYYPPAMSTMAILYLNGFGVLRSPGKAWKLFMHAANLGDSFAMYNLGLMYFRGVGVRRDEFEAADWFKKSAEAGDARAWVYLGTLYLKGQGVFKRYDKAERCFKNAADKGDGEAMMWLGLMWKNGIGRDKDLIKAQEWFLKAVEAGYAPAKERIQSIEESRTF